MAGYQTAGQEGNLLDNAGKRAGRREVLWRWLLLLTSTRERGVTSSSTYLQAPDRQTTKHVALEGQASAGPAHPSQELALHTTACTAHRRPAPATHRISVISTAKAERPSSGESEEKLRSMKASGISRQLLQAGGRQGGTKEGEGETSSSWVLAAGGNVVGC